MNNNSTAVLAIDFQNEYRPLATYPVEGYDTILANAASLIAAARQAGVSVIHAQGWAGEGQQNYRLLQETVAEEFKYGRPDADGTAICHEVAPIGDEVVIRKPWPSVFRDTPLTESLRSSGVKNLLVAGVWTDSCVRASVFDAVFAGFCVWLVKDACGSGTDFMHRVAILDMANRLYGGGVFETSEAIKAFQGKPYEAWRCSRPVEFQYTLETADAHYNSL